MSSLFKPAALFGLLTLTAIPAIADASTTKFLYQLNGYPKTNQSCHVEARNLAERFSALTATTATGECKAINDLTYDISIVYTATEELTLVTTYPDTVFPDKYHVFKTEADCKSALGTELDHFKSATGLEPLIAICAVDETYFDLKSWAIRIDAFGTTQTRPFWAQSLMTGKVDGMSEAEAETLIAETFLREGVDVRFASLRNDHQGIRRLGMLYYSQKPLNVEIQVLASSLDSREQCQAELQQIISIAPAFGPHALFCSDNKFVQTFEVLGVVELSTWFRAKASVESFKNYSDCSAGRAELIDIYRNTAGRDVAGGLCSKIDGVWRLNLMERTIKPE